MLTHKCDNCDSSGYAEPGGMAYTVRMASIQKDKTTPEPVPKAPNEPKPEAPPQPTKKARNSVFDMSTI